MERSRFITVALIVLSCVIVFNGRQITSLSALQLISLMVFASLVHVLGYVSVSFKRIGPFFPIFSFLMAITFLLISNSHGNFSGVIPSIESLGNLYTDLQSGIQAIRSTSSPYEYSTEIFVTLALGLWVISEILETFSQRLRSCAPSIIFFVIISAIFASLESSPSSLSLIITVGTASGFFLYAFERGQQTLESQLITIPNHSRYINIARMSTSFILIILLSIILAIPVSFTPNIGPQNIFKWLNNSPNKQELSPLVGMSQKLRDQQTTLLFTAHAKEAQYYRVEVLDDFDGTSWTRSTSKKGTSEQPPQGVQTRLLESDVKISGLSGKNLPTFYSVQSLSHPNSEILEYATARTKKTSLSSYSFSSLIPPKDLTTDQIEASSGDFPKSLDKFTWLPGKDVKTGVDNFDPALIKKATDIVKGQSSYYGQVMALKNFFLDGSFTYDLNVDYTSDTTSMSNFLKSRRGFCEQFATTYAAMARSIGIPSRVVIGFSPGTPDANGMYSITNKQAHSWVEVYLSNFGWLTIDPTPTGDQPGQAPNNIGAVTPTTTTTTTLSNQSTTAPVTNSQPTTTLAINNKDNKSKGSIPFSAAAIIILLMIAGSIIFVREKKRNKADEVYIVDTLKNIGQQVLSYPPTPDTTIAELIERLDDNNPEVLEFLNLLTLYSYAPNPHTSKLDVRRAASKARSHKVLTK